MNNLTFLDKAKIFKVMMLISLFIVVIGIHHRSYASDVAGKTILAKGKVEAIDKTSKEKRKLQRRSEIFSVDNITTGNKSKAQFSMSDGGLITLKENTEILISNYKFSPEVGESSATLEVVSGGLRSISGLIKKSGGDYQVKTPVGSIGIRGTHFAVEVVGEEVFFAVYSGNIDVQLNDQSILSLGGSEEFTFASVNTDGQITRMTQAPVNISLGYSDVSSKNTEQNTADEASDNEQLPQNVSVNSAVPSIQVEPLQDDDENIDDNSVYSESEWQGIGDIATGELLSERTGMLAYNNISQSSVNSSVGQVNDFTMSMTVDFDNASVPGGTLSFSDSQGEWFAAYSGLININKLDLGINFASHGNNRADGIIFGAFANGLDQIIGGFRLKEINNPSVNAGGSFKLHP